MDGLRIADDFTVPVELVVQQSSILARTGAGKTNAATVIVEELLSAGQQVVIIDPPGAWWGLTASADGAADGYSVVVLGGEHGDVPLPPAGGALIADIVVDQGVSAILDLSDLSNAQISTFVLAFATRLYERKARARSPLLLVIEEADEVAPQRVMPDQTRMLGAIERVVKRGRMRGIGTLMISQRSASLNKNVLSQSELLVAMQTTAPQDIKAIDAWIEHHGDRERRSQLISEIATLGKGEAFIWSPGWLHEFRKIRFRLRHTFDSSATPKPGETPIEPTARAEIDVDAIRDLLATQEAQHKTTSGAGATRDQKRALAEQANLISELQGVNEELQRQLQARSTLDTDLVATLKTEVDALRSVAMRIIDAADGISAQLVRALPMPAQAPIVEPPTRPSAPTDTRVSRKSESRPASAVAATTTLTAAQQRLLDTLASYEVLGVLELDRRTLAVSAGVSPRSSAYDANVRALRAAGLVVYPTEGYVALVNAGRSLARTPDAPPTLADLHAGWVRILTSAQTVLLRLLIGRYPGSYARPALAEAAGVSARSSAFDANIRHLRSLGLVSYPEDRHVACTELLFPEGLR